MTEFGVKDITNRVKDRQIIPPDGMTLVELNAWLLGYATCQADVLEILHSLAPQCDR